MIQGYYYQPNGPHGLPPSPVPYYGIRRHPTLGLQIEIDFLDTGKVWINIKEEWVEPIQTE